MNSLLLTAACLAPLVRNTLAQAHMLLHTHTHTQSRPCQQPPNQAKQTLKTTTLHYSAAKQATNSKQKACQPRPRPTKKQALKSDIALAPTLWCNPLKKSVSCCCCCC